MKSIAACLVMVVACGSAASAGDGVASQSPEMMAVALVQLVTVDNTFYEGLPPTAEFLILDRIDPSAGDPTGSTRSTRALTAAERGAIEDALAEYGTVRWGVADADPDAFQMLLGVGEPVIEDDTALVPVSMICGNMCGTWLTYRLAVADDKWVVTGIEGPISIS